MLSVIIRRAKMLYYEISVDRDALVKNKNNINSTINKENINDDKLEEYYNPMINLLTEIYYSLS